MKSISALACLLALIPANGWLAAARPSAEANFLSSRTTPARAALLELVRRGRSLRQSGDPVRALEIFRQGRHEALLQNDSRLQAQFLWGIAQSHMAQHRYAEALEESLAVRDAFSASGVPPY